MTRSPGTSEAAVEVSSPDGGQHIVHLTAIPFFFGRGEDGNHLVIPDDRVSRKCAAIVSDGGGYCLEDRGNRRGVFVNGGKVARHALQEGDIISFGTEVPYSLVFHSSSADTSPIQQLVSRMESVGETDSSSGGLTKLNLLLEATRLLHSQLPLDTVLDAMLDRAIAVIDADRALLLEAEPSGTLRRRVARRSGGLGLPPENFVPSQTAVDLALAQQSGVITEDLEQADELLQSAQSIVNQSLRSVVAIPLYAMSQTKAAGSGKGAPQRQFLGVMYLDSRRRAAFSNVDRQILDALAIESASVLDNARLVKLEQERQRVEQELGIARDIQQALLPRGFRDFPHVTITGLNIPCHEVGGDYFDIFKLGDDRVAFLIADVSGKGLGAALLTTMLQGAFSSMTTGTDPEQVFQRINGLLCERSEVGRYATLFFATLDRRGNLVYLNAGHPPPLLLHHGEVTDLFTEGSLPVGLLPEARHSAVSRVLEPEDTLVLFSDGITEAENKEGEFFGETRFHGVLRGRQDAALDVLQKTIVQSVREFTNSANQADDITVLLARYRRPA